MTLRSTHAARALAGAVSLTAALAANPAEARAGDCGADYVACLDARDLIGRSDALHEGDCWSAYWRCVSRRILTH
jgi:hypothetical protein